MRPCNNIKIDIANRLDQLQHLIDSGAIDQSNFNLNINSDQQLEDMNAWLTDLSHSIEPYYEQPLPNPNPPIVPSQQIYPENDLYIRSQPIIVSDQNIQDFSGMTTGQRQHYTAVPNMSANYFYPELRTTTNFTSSPKNGETTKQEVDDSFKPTSITFEEKKNMATLVNSFSSALADKPVKKEAEKAPETEKEVDRLKELIVSDLSKLSLNETKHSPIQPSVLYPATAKISNRRQKHVQLLKQMKEWMNENYRATMTC